MSKRLAPIEAPVTIDFEGRQLEARPGETVAATLLANDVRVFSRSVKYHRPRGPFCLTGGCSQCLMRVDGVPNIATCQTPSRAGLRVERQNAFPDASIDVFQATDLVFRKWFNHHEFLAGVPVAEQVMLAVARKLSGLGTLPDAAAPTRPAARTEEVNVAIVGGGAAGLAVARTLTERGVPYVLYERENIIGGGLVSAAEQGAPAVFTPPADSFRTSANVVGLFQDAGRTFLAVTSQGQLTVVFPKTIVLAPGGHPMLTTFENNDLPGVLAGRAVARLIRRHQLLPGQRVACVGEVMEARELASLVNSVGGEAVAVGQEPLEALGLRRVQAVRVKTTSGDERVACDVIALCSGVSPSFELARSGGARVSWDPRSRVFVVDTDATGRTANRNLFAVGEARGRMSAAAAAEQGLLAGQAIAAEARP